MSDGPHRKHHSPRQVLVYGALCVAFGAIPLLLPLVLGRWEYNKYMVVVGFLIICVGISFLLHGTVDFIRGKR